MTDARAAQNMVAPGAVDDDLQAETQDECSRFGPVREVVVNEAPAGSVPDEEAVRIFVEFEKPQSAVDGALRGCACTHADPRRYSHRPPQPTAAFPCIASAVCNGWPVLRWSKGHSDTVPRGQVSGTRLRAVVDREHARNFDFSTFDFSFAISHLKFSRTPARRVLARALHAKHVFALRHRCKNNCCATHLGAHLAGATGTCTGLCVW